MEPDVDNSSRSPALSREADRIIADLHQAIRCLCCSPRGGIFGRLIEHETSSEDEQPPTLARALRRSDFLGMLEKHEVDAELGGVD